MKVKQFLYPWFVANSNAEFIIMLTGGEVRMDTPSPMVHAAIVSEGVNIASDELPAIYVLQQALGSTSFVQNGANSSSKILKAASAVASQPFTVSTASFNSVVGSET